MDEIGLTPFVNRSAKYPNFKVFNLINREDDTWNNHMIKQVLASIDSEQVENITIHNCMVKDQKVWLPDRKG